MLQFKAVEGQSIYDICLQTYGSLDYMVKLLQDNGLANVNISPFSGQIFVWDETLAADRTISRNTAVIYATKALSNELSNTIINAGSPGSPGNVVSGGGSDPNIPVASLMLYIGSAVDLTPSEETIKAMTARSAVKGSQLFTYTVDTMRFCFSYPTYLGSISSVKDTNGFEIKSGFTTTVSNFTINGISQSYTTMVLSRPTTQNNFNVIFTL